MRAHQFVQYGYTGHQPIRNLWTYIPLRFWLVLKTALRPWELKALEKTLPERRVHETKLSLTHAPGKSWTAL
jgi:hypothetical protein